MTVNGRPYAHREGLTLHALLRELRVPLERTAVAVNDDFYPGSRAPDVPLRDGDVIEIVRAIAGG